MDIENSRIINQSMLFGYFACSYIAKEKIDLQKNRIRTKVEKTQ